MTAVELATAYISLVPSMQGVQGAVARELAPVSGIADRESKKAGKRFAGGFSSATKGMAAGLGAAFAAVKVKDFLGDSIAEARESQKVGALTTQIIKSTGGAAKVTSKQVGDLATSISNKAGMDDEAIQSGANLLLTFKNVRNEAGKGNDMFNQATKAAVDLSAAGFGSVETASKTLGKALNDPLKGMTAMSRMGVTFTQDQKAMADALVNGGWDKALIAMGVATKDSIKAALKAADGDVGKAVAKLTEGMSKSDLKKMKFLEQGGHALEAQKMIMKEVNSQVGGAAEASATTGEKLAVTWGNFKETVGTALLPVIDVLMAKMTALLGWIVGTGIPALKTFGGFVKDNRVAFILAGAAIATFVAGLAIYRATVAVVTKATAAWNVVQKLLNGTMRLNPIGLIITGLVLLVAGLVLAYKKSDTFRAVVNKAWSAVKAGAQALWTYLKFVFSAWRAGISKVADVFGVAKRGISVAWSGIKSGASNAWNFVKGVFGKLRDGVGAVKTAFAKAKDGIGDAWNKIKGIVKAPVKWAIEHVINDGLIDGINGLLPGNPLNRIKLKGWESGGYTGRLHPSQVAGFVHGDEHVIRSKARRKIEAQYPGALDYMNAHGRLPGYKKGGRVKPLKNPPPWTTYPGHTGIDFPVPSGTPVYATESGRIASRRSLAYSYGKHYFMKGASGFTTIYAHLSRLVAAAGQKMSAGQLLGYSGSTGNSTGPHLHFEVRPGGTSGAAAAYLGGAGKPSGKGGGAVASIVKAASWLGNKFNFAKKLRGWMSGMGDRTGIFGDSLSGFVKSMGTRIWGAIKDKVGGVAGTAKSIAGKIGDKLKFFDDGGLASGTGYLPKATLAPERVLSPRQTRSFEAAMDRDFGGTGGGEVRLAAEDLDALIAGVILAAERLASGVADRREFEQAVKSRVPGAFAGGGL